MKFSEEILKQFDLETEEEREPVSVMKISEMLDFMRTSTERIEQKSRQYLHTQDAGIQMDCIDIVTARLNDFVQVFKDFVIFLRKEEKSYRGGDSLRYCVASFDSFDFEQSESEKLFLQELLLRNEITHDYFNYELHRRKLIWIMENCNDGGIKIYEHLYKYCQEHQLMDKYAEKIRHNSTI